MSLLISVCNFRIKFKYFHALFTSLIIEIRKNLLQSGFSSSPFGQSGFELQTIEKDMHLVEFLHLYVPELH